MSDMFIENKKRRIWPYILGTIVLIFFAIGVGAYHFVRRFNPINFITSSFVQDYVQKHVGEDAGEAVALLPEILGFNEPRTYLLLLLNNTELRPGGGFIGVYAVVTVNKGEIEIDIIEGTEGIDARTPAEWKPVPPAPLAQYLGVDRWYFRDSNWSPDFAESAKKTLELYRGEGGQKVDEIDAVVGITPTVLEEILQLTGPVTVNGFTFTPENAVETLEYEVEYGYAKRGIPFAERKRIIAPLAHELLARLKQKVLSSYKQYIVTGQRLVKERHIMAYTKDEKLARLVKQFDATGEIKDVGGDYLLWVDANLGALKTDHAIERSLSYEIEPDGDGYRATAYMVYTHKGAFDWRTTRYRTYARVFVPKSAKLLGAGELGSLNADEGEENGRKWFGAFISIEPGETKTLEFSYRLPGEIVKDGTYRLYVQKQLGAVSHRLTVSLDFGKTITAAMPAEKGSKTDFSYGFKENVKTDKEFELTFSK